eukprot:6327431-Prymnesium_polylepis.1
MCRCGRHVRQGERGDVRRGQGALRARADRGRRATATGLCGSGAPLARIPRGQGAPGSSRGRVSVWRPPRTHPPGTGRPGV